MQAHIVSFDSFLAQSDGVKGRCLLVYFVTFMFWKNIGIYRQFLILCVTEGFTYYLPSFKVRVNNIRSELATALDF